MLLAVGTFTRNYLLLFALANLLAALRCVAGALVPSWRPRPRGFPGSPVLSAWACYGLALFSAALSLASLTEAGELAGLLPWRLWVLAVGILALLAGLTYEHTRRPRASERRSDLSVPPSKSTIRALFYLACLAPGLLVLFSYTMPNNGGFYPSSLPIGLLGLFLSGLLGGLGLLLSLSAAAYHRRAWDLLLATLVAALPLLGMLVLARLANK